MIDRIKSGGRTYIQHTPTMTVVVEEAPAVGYRDPRPVPVAIFAEQKVAEEYVRRDPRPLRVVNVPFEPNYEELKNSGHYWEVRFDDDGNPITLAESRVMYGSRWAYGGGNEQYAKKINKPSTTPIHYRILEKGFGPVSANRGELILTVYAKDAKEAVAIATKKRLEYIQLTKSMHGP